MTVEASVRAGSTQRFSNNNLSTRDSYRRFLTSTLVIWVISTVALYFGYQLVEPIARNTDTTNVPKKYPREIELGLDVVVVAALDDAAVFVHHALPSLVLQVHDLRFIYVVCQASMCDHLESLKSDVNTEDNIIAALHRVHVVQEDEPGLFPFTLNDVALVREEAGIKQASGDLKDRNKWTYQQLLKLYSPIVLSTLGGKRPSILRTTLIVDADTVWLKPVSFLRMETRGQMPQTWYSVASVNTGAFRTDALYGEDHVAGLFGKGALEKPGKTQNSSLNCVRATVSTPLLDGGRLGDALTAITHHSAFQRHVVIALFDGISVSCGVCLRPQASGGCEPWSRLATVTPFLSEYELYLAFAASRFPETVALRALPYVNMGLLRLVPPGSSSKPSSYRVPLKLEPSPAYVTLHDDYDERAICCVNTADDKKIPDCMPCGASDGPIAKESLLSAVQRLNMCQGLIFSTAPKSPLYRPAEHTNATRALAWRRIGNFVSCVRDAELPPAEGKN